MMSKKQYEVRFLVNIGSDSMNNIIHDLIKTIQDKEEYLDYLSIEKRDVKV